MCRCVAVSMRRCVDARFRAITPPLLRPDTLRPHHTDRELSRADPAQTQQLQMQAMSSADILPGATETQQMRVLVPAGVSAR